MSVSEADRFELQLKLRTMLGDEMADILMEHLPPSGWSDVARKTDTDHIESLMNSQFVSIDSRLNGLTHGLWALASLMSACFIATFTILATRL